MGRGSAMVRATDSAMAKVRGWVMAWAMGSAMAMGWVKALVTAAGSKQ